MVSSIPSSKEILVDSVVEALIIIEWVYKFIYALDPDNYRIHLRNDLLNRHYLLSLIDCV